LTPGGSNAVHIYTQTVQYTFTHKQYSTHLHTNSTVHNNTQTVHRTTQTKKQYLEQHNSLIRKSAGRAPSLCEFYPGVCLKTEEKARENLSQGRRRVPVGTMETEYTEQNIHNNKNICTIIYYNIFSLYNVHSYMFRHLRVILREFQKFCTSLNYIRH
jgi:hypothetical protein